MLKELPVLLSKSVKNRIERNHHVRILDIILSQMGLKNINHLRDRFEGQAYLDRFLMKTYSEMTLYRVLGMDEENNYLDLKEQNFHFKPDFRINGKSVEITYSTSNIYPLIPKGDYEILAFVFVSLQSFSTSLLGFVKQKDLIPHIETDLLTPIESQSYQGRLKNLKIVKPLELLFKDSV